MLSVAHGAELIPSAPKGWIEMNSIEPVALTWVKAEPDKKLKDVPTLMVQVLGNSEKISKLFKEHKLDKNGCFSITHQEWEQTWCGRSRETFVLLSKNTDPDLIEKRAILESWILSHD